MVKHAGPAHVDVRIRYGHDELELEVTDDGRGAASELDSIGGGHGLVGHARARRALRGRRCRPDHARRRLPGDGPAPLPGRGGGPVIRVLVADDQALVRGGFTVLLDHDPDIDVVGEASTGAEAVDLTARHHPDVVLMDIRMPDMDGIEATRRITEDPACASTRVLVLTTFDLDEYVFDALRAGASGFLLKDTQPTELLDAIRVVAEGEALLSPAHHQQARRRLRRRASERSRAVDADRWRCSPIASARCWPWPAGGARTPRSPRSSTSAWRRPRPT